MKNGGAPIAAAFIIALTAGGAHAQTREQWIDYGARVHGGFGTFIAVGIRIGEDALKRLEAKPRDVTVTFWSGAKSPCPCAIDGIIVATSASPGQRTAKVADEAAPAGAMLVAEIARKSDGVKVRYVVAESWLPKLAEWNKAHDPAGRFDEVMKAQGLFEATRLEK